MWRIACAALLLTACSRAPAPAPKHMAEPRIRAGDTLWTPVITQHVWPVYPRKARLRHISGVVKLRATVDKTGAVRDLQPISGDPLLIPAAVTAVKQWRYKPCTLHGEPIDVVTQMDINFSLPR